MTNILSSLGMSENEGLVYEYLLKRGAPLGASKVAAALKMHRQYAHTALQKLVENNLVERVVVGARPKYQALPPRYMAQLARKRFEEAERAARALEAVSNVGADQESEVFRGRQQILDGETDFVHQLPMGATQYIIGGGSKAFTQFFGDEYEPISSVAKEHKLKTLYVAAPAELPHLELPIRVMRDFEVRVLDDLPETIVQTVIRLDSVTLYTFGNPPLTYTVKSKAVYEDYKKFFYMLWNKARPV